MSATVLVETGLLDGVVREVEGATQEARRSQLAHVVRIHVVDLSDLSVRDFVEVSQVVTTNKMLLEVID